MYVVTEPMAIVEVCVSAGIRVVVGALIVAKLVRKSVVASCTILPHNTESPTRVGFKVTNATSVAITADKHYNQIPSILIPPYMHFIEITILGMSQAVEVGTQFIVFGVFSQIAVNQAQARPNLTVVVYAVSLVECQLNECVDIARFRTSTLGVGNQNVNCCA